MPILMVLMFEDTAINWVKKLLLCRVYCSMSWRGCLSSGEHVFNGHDET